MSPVLAAAIWSALAALALLLGAWIALTRSPSLRAVGLTAAFGAGALLSAVALLTMLVNDLIPEARERGTLLAGPVAVLGFAVAFALHQIGG